MRHFHAFHRISGLSREVAPLASLGRQIDFNKLYYDDPPAQTDPHERLTSMVLSRLLSTSSSEIDFPAGTSRLRFIPVTDALADHEAAGSSYLSTALSVDVPPSWPPQPVVPTVQANAEGWKNCYLAHAGPNGGRSVLVGAAGHKKWSPEHRTLQIGTVLIPEYHGQHLGEEVVAALAKWGLAQPGIDRVICDVPDDHKASAKSLERAGFARSAQPPAVGFIRFEIFKQE